MIHGSISHVKSAAAAAKREKEVPQNWSKIFLKLQELTKLNVGMAIPRRISFLGDSRNQGMAIFHSSGSSGNFGE